MAHKMIIVSPKSNPPSIFDPVLTSCENQHAISWSARTGTEAPVSVDIVARLSEITVSAGDNCKESCAYRQKGQWKTHRDGLIKSIRAFLPVYFLGDGSEKCVVPCHVCCDQFLNTFLISTGCRYDENGRAVTSETKPHDLLDPLAALYFNIDRLSTLDRRRCESYSRGRMTSCKEESLCLRFTIGRTVTRFV